MLQVGVCDYPKDPGIVFLRQVDGHWHSWDDNERIFETFSLSQEGLKRPLADEE
jgi:hypothetical protein